MTSFARYDRRAFLQGMGVGGALLPLLGARRARAADPTPPRRLVVCAWSNGFIWDDFWPKGGETDFTLGKTLSPLAPYRDKMLIVGGVGHRVQLDANARALGYGKERFFGGHDGYPAVLTGVPLSKYADFLEWSGGDSVDQYVAAKIAATTPLAFPSLVLGVFPSSGYHGTVSYKGASPGITPEGDPTKLFNRLFEGRNLPSGQLDKLRLERKSVLDYLGKSLTHFGKRLGTEDKRKVEAHLQSIRDVERQFTGEATMTAGCRSPGAVALNHNDPAQVPTTMKTMSDLIVSSMKCDLTRVATFMLSNAGGEKLVFSWLGSDYVGKGDEYPTRQFHDITHNAGRSAAHTARKIRVDQWFFEQVAYLVKQLAETPEGGGTMLDNTAVVITNSMGRNHESDITPFIIVGSCGGYFKRLGRYLKYGDFASNRNARRGVHHNGVLVAVANAMGADGSKFGEPSLAKELPGLTG